MGKGERKLMKINEHDALKALIEGDLVKYKKLMDQKYAGTIRELKRLEEQQIKEIENVS